MRIVTAGAEPQLILSPDSLPNVQELQTELEHVEKQLRESARIQKILDRLPQSWRELDPGKHGPAYWLLDSSGRQAVVRELLPKGIEQFQGERQDWIAHRSRLGQLGRLDVVPPCMPLISFADTLKAECPECGADQPLIESYHQTYDSPSGDEWQRQHLLLCCGKVQVLNSESRPNRF